MTCPRPSVSAYQLATRTYAVRIAHFPPSWEELAIARRRLVFEELTFHALRQRRTEEEGFQLTMPCCPSSSPALSGGRQRTRLVT